METPKHNLRFTSSTIEPCTTWLGVLLKKRMKQKTSCKKLLLVLLKKLDQFSGQVTFGAWLKKIVINKAIVAFRKQRKQDTIGLVEEIYTIYGPLADATHQTNNEKKAALVLETIARLKENYRISLTLHLIEVLTHKEVSELLGISSSNCRTTFSRAKEQLRNQLETHPLWKKL